MQLWVAMKDCGLMDEAWANALVGGRSTGRGLFSRSGLPYPGVVSIASCLGVILPCLAFE